MINESTITELAAKTASAALSGVTGGGAILMLGEGFALANRIIGLIDNPAARSKARREYIDSLDVLRLKIKTEQDYEKMDALILELIADIHNK
jgi:hypothetical protein